MYRMGMAKRTQLQHSQALRLKLSAATCLKEKEKEGGLCSLCPPRARQQSSCLRREMSSFQAQDPRAQHCIHDLPYQRDGDSIPCCCVNCSV